MSSRRSKSGRRSGNPARQAAARTPEAPGKARTTKRARPGGSAGAPHSAPRRGRSSPVGAWLARRWAALVQAMLQRSPHVPRLRAVKAPALADLERADAVWAIATALAAAALFATILSSHPPLSDGSEGVAGVASVGILHAPGYPSYVIAARLFTWLIPFGDLTFRVGLFSLVCAAGSVALVQLLARRLGAARWAASLGALSLAASAGYWFYAAYTKHDQFSGLTFTVALYLLVAWDARPNRWRLIGVAAALAVGLGSSWPLTILLGPAVLYVLVRGWRKLTVGAFALSTLTGAVLLVGIYGFVIVRAEANPPINWGDATSLTSLKALVERSDFVSGGSNSVQSPASFHAHPFGGQAHPFGGGQAPSNGLGGGGTGASPPASVPGAGTPPGAGAIAVAGSFGASRASSGIDNYARMFWRELGVLGFLLAAWGGLASLIWRRNRASVPLLLAFGGNLLGAAGTVGPHSSSYDVDLIEEGFVLGCYFVLAIWIAIGATDLVSRVAKLRLSVRRFLAPGLIAALVGLTIVPQAIAGWPVAHRSDNDFADRYAETVFSELPRHSVLFVWGSDLNFPLDYRQVVYHQRRDVVVVSVGGLAFDWYREEIGQELGRPLPPIDGSPVHDLAHLIGWLGDTRPVYMDEQATEYMNGIVGYRTVGLVSHAIPGTKAVIQPPATLERTIVAAERSADLSNPDWQVWPNSYLQQADYTDTALKAARYFFDEHNLTGMKAALLNVVHIDPGDPAATKDLALLASSGSAGGGG